MKKKSKTGMTVSDYKKIHDMIIALSIDADGYGLFDRISEEDVEKCKWIAAILETLNDVPLSRVEHIFEQKEIEFDYEEFWCKNYND
ncbi:hypothetical protein [Pseudoflavonifractor phocaeensis]|uniref:hypothetical protein n=1 Tax=Pseudoflavonifractor phocaeensis TaxID=1870988 RepID=UPI001F3D81A5|nr:hypothetical protein [Pseudoflavonifractor phocaeensis]MCF2595307.1 hypothetical protein [Pseudoflavonifractor phocaeensis]MDY3906762.1 hypothetical protein [Lawsonibacter sp.]